MRTPRGDHGGLLPYCTTLCLACQEQKDNKRLSSLCLHPIVTTTSMYHSNRRDARKSVYGGVVSRPSMIWLEPRCIPHTHQSLREVLRPCMYCTTCMMSSLSQHVATIDNAFALLLSCIPYTCFSICHYDEVRGKTLSPLGFSYIVNILSWDTSMYRLKRICMSDIVPFP